MTPTRSSSRRERERNLPSPSSPRPWPAYPFVPVVRRTGEGEECGLPTDPAGLFGLFGFGPTVFPADPFDPPTTPAAFLALPRRAFDSADEVYDAGGEQARPPPAAEPDRAAPLPEPAGRAGTPPPSLPGRSPRRSGRRPATAAGSRSPG